MDNAPNDATSFQAEECLMMLVVERCAAHVHDMGDSTLSPFLFNDGTEALDSGVSIQADWAGAVGDGMSIREDEGG